MMNDREGQVLYDLFSSAHRHCPEDKVSWWIDDHQGGGEIEYITREEEARREAVLARCQATGQEPDPRPVWM